MISKEASARISGELEAAAQALSAAKSGMALTAEQTLQLSMLLTRAAMALNTADEVARRGALHSEALGAAQLEASLLSDLKAAAIAWLNAKPGRCRREAESDLIEQIKAAETHGES